MHTFHLEPGFDNHLGYTHVESDKTSAHLNLVIKKEHTNFHNYVHGGVYYSLSDSACGFVVQNMGGNWVTLEGHIKYIKAAKAGTLDVFAKLLSQSSKLANIEVEVYNGKQLSTKGSFTMYKIEKKKEG